MEANSHFSQQQHQHYGYDVFQRGHFGPYMLSQQHRVAAGMNPMYGYPPGMFYQTGMGVHAGLGSMPHSLYSMPVAPGYHGYWPGHHPAATMPPQSLPPQAHHLPQATSTTHAAAT